jgi:hypothetical protein
VIDDFQKDVSLRFLVARRKARIFDLGYHYLLWVTAATSCQNDVINR